MLHLKFALCLLQHDTSVPIPSPVSASVYGRIPITNFAPNLPAFPSDAFGVSDRPKKVTLLSIVLKLAIWLRKDKQMKEHNDVFVFNAGFGRILTWHVASLCF